MGVYMGTLRVGVEVPTYDTLKKMEGYEIRRYGEVIAASVCCEEGTEVRGSEGFRALANYIGAFGAPKNQGKREAEGEEGGVKISMTAPVVTKEGSKAEGGDNKKGESIKMTAPVVTKEESIKMTAPVVTKEGSKAEGGGYWMAFIVPGKYNMDTIPKPLDERVKVHPIPPRIVASRYFSGNTKTKESIDKQEEILRGALARDGISPVKGTERELARYNDPFTPWFLRTNEIWIEVDYKT